MPIGSKWELYVPSDLAYGDEGYGDDIAPGSTLVFEVELLSIKKNAANTPPAPEPSRRTAPTRNRPDRRGKVTPLTAWGVSASPFARFTNRGPFAIGPSVLDMEFPELFLRNFTGGVHH